MQTKLARAVSKVFALDGRASAVEYGVIAAVILTALVSTILAMGDTLGVLLQAVINGPKGV